MAEKTPAEEKIKEVKMEEEYKLPKELEDRTWAKEYLSELQAMNMEDLLYAMLESQEADDYDGGFTSRQVYTGNIAVGYFHYRLDILEKKLMEAEKLLKSLAYEGR